MLEQTLEYMALHYKHNTYTAANFADAAASSSKPLAKVFQELCDTRAVKMGSKIIKHVLQKVDTTGKLKATVQSLAILGLPMGQLHFCKFIRAEQCSCKQGIYDTTVWFLASRLTGFQWNKHVGS